MLFETSTIILKLSHSPNEKFSDILVSKWTNLSLVLLIKVLLIKEIACRLINRPKQARAGGGRGGLEGIEGFSAECRKGSLHPHYIS